MPTNPPLNFDNFINAAKQGGSEGLFIVNEYSDRGGDINQRDATGKSALIWAVFHGHQDIVLSLLAAPLISIFDDGEDALHIAIINNRPDIAAAIVNKMTDKDVLQLTKSKITNLANAAPLLDIIDARINYLAQNAVPTYLEFFEAIDSNDLEMVNSYLAANSDNLVAASINAIYEGDTGDISALALAASLNHIEIFFCLLNIPYVNINAGAFNDIEEYRLHLTNKGDALDRNKYSLCALVAACIQDNTEIALALITNPKCNRNAIRVAFAVDDEVEIDGNNDDAIHNDGDDINEEAKADGPRIIDDPVIEDDDDFEGFYSDYSPLIAAAKNNNMTLLSALLACGDVDINKINANKDLKESALTAASAAGHARIVSALLDRIDLNLERDGIVALEEAADGNHSAVVAILLPELLKIKHTLLNYNIEYCYELLDKFPNVPAIATLAKAQIEEYELSFPSGRLKKLEETLGPVTIPDNLLDPISHSVMDDPIKLSSGIIYCRRQLIAWAAGFDSDKFSCPLSRKEIFKTELRDNPTLTDVKEAVEIFVAQQAARIAQPEPFFTRKRRMDSDDSNPNKEAKPEEKPTSPVSPKRKL